MEKLESYRTTIFLNLFVCQTCLGVIRAAGDEVLEWNEMSLVDCTFEEVLEIISSTEDCPDLHLVLCRDK